MNPWSKLPKSPPFVLGDDRTYVEAFNRLVQLRSPEAEPSNPAHRKLALRAWLDLDVTPEPRLGPVSAPVIVLQLNASYDPAVVEGIEEQVRRLQSASDEHHPHLGLLENKWWEKKFKALIGEFGRDHLARNVCSVEYFPYRSLGFGHSHIRLPSQQYTFDLVDRFVREGRLILVMRGWTEWVGAVPSLLGQLNKCVFQTRNKQQTYVSRGNLDDGVYDRLCKLLSDCR